MRADPLRLIGVTVDGKYDVQELVEQRGPRLMYRAEHRVWGEPVALTCFAEPPHQDPSHREAHAAGYINACAAMARLSCKTAAFVQVRDSGTVATAAGTIPYAVFEWLDALPLRAVLDEAQVQGRGRVGIVLALEWFAEPIRALTLAHAEGITHGALHPGNIFVMGGSLRPPGQIKLRGFTDAALRSGLGVPLAAKPDDSWLPPELCGDYDPSFIGPWTDVWGLARVFAELLTGRPPSERKPNLGTEDAMPSVLHALERGLAPLSDRFRSIDQFRSALVAALPQGASRSRPRQTMVVSQQQADDGGSAGAFEVAGEEPDVEPISGTDLDAPRVRFAHTQRVLNPLIFSEPDEGVNVPRAREPIPKRPAEVASRIPGVTKRSIGVQSDASSLPLPRAQALGSSDRESRQLVWFVVAAVLVGGALGYVATFFVSA